MGDDSDCRYFGDLIVDNDKLRAEIEEQKKANAKLKEHHKELLSELSIVKWYLEFMESGFNIKDVVKQI